QDTRSIPRIHLSNVGSIVTPFLVITIHFTYLKTLVCLKQFPHLGFHFTSQSPNLYLTSLPMDLDSNYFPTLNRTRSGYEPSDVETDWKESPFRGNNNNYRAGFDSDTDLDLPAPTSNRQFRRFDAAAAADDLSSSPEGTSISSLSRRKTKSPHKNHNPRPRSASATRVRMTRDKVEVLKRNPPPLYPVSSNASRSASVGELNEMIGTMKLSARGGHLCESTDDLTTGDIFFSRDVTLTAAPPLPPPSARFHKVNEEDPKASTRSSNSASSGSRTTTSSNNSTASYKLSSDTSKVSDASARTTDFVANRKKSSQSSDSNWLSCIKGRSCRVKHSPEKQRLDESSFIARANVVENLTQFWADKYQPTSLKAFTYHKQEAQLLRQLVSRDNIPHILFKGPSISGKTALMMALLGDIFGDACLNMSHDLRFFQAQEKKGAQVVVPITSSAHHVELNVKSEPTAMSALMGLVKEISNAYSLTPDISTINPRPEYKVILLYEADRAPENIQHLIKWIMDCYTDCCKLILCCDDDVDVLESVRNRCKVVTVNAPATHEIMEVLVHIAKKEGFDLPMNFAAKIATKSKDLRRGIMALEACRAHNYPFANDQPIPIGWEEVLVEISNEIMADPSPKRLFLVRGKLQKLLVDFVHPQLILQKLVQQFLKEMPSGSKRELYYWNSYYEKRLPTGTTALLKLEEFVAKFMSMYRKSIGSRQF
ncbi:Replication factor C subunit 3, partial [Linum grandiflorum]